MSTLELQNIKKSFEQTTVIHGVNLSIENGEFVVFVGPSGCGKSTLLRMIAGLDFPTSGSILIDSEPVNHIGAADRGCAMVFQSYALYPHMTVYDNMAFGLENAHVPKAEIVKKVGEAAALLRLDTLLKRRQRSSQAVSGSGLPLVARSYVIPSCSCLMSRCLTWMRSFGSRCALNCVNCISA